LPERDLDLTYLCLGPLSLLSLLSLPLLLLPLELALRLRFLRFKSVLGLRSPPLCFLLLLFAGLALLYLFRLTGGGLSPLGLAVLFFLTGLAPPLATTFLLFFFTGGGSSSLELSSLELFLLFCCCSFLLLLLPFKLAFLGAIFGGAFSDFFIFDFLAGAAAAAELPDEDELDALLELAAEELELAELDLELLLETDRDLCFLTGILETFLLGLATGLGERLLFFLVIFLCGDGDFWEIFCLGFLTGLEGFRLAVVVFRPRFTGDTERAFLAYGIFCHFRAGGDRFGDPRDDLRAGDRFGDSRDDLRAGDLFGDPLEALRAGDLFGDPLEALRGDLRVDLPGDLLVGDPLDDLLEGRGDLLRGDPLDDLLGDLLGDLIGDFPNVLPGGDFPGDFRLLDLFKLLLLDRLLA